jgi:hypothetical protein
LHREVRLFKTRLHISTIVGGELRIVAPLGVFSEEGLKLLGDRLKYEGETFHITPLPGETLHADEIHDYELERLVFATVGNIALSLVVNPASHDRIEVSVVRPHITGHHLPDPDYASYHGRALHARPEPN